VSQNWTQRNESQKNVLQHAQKSNTFVNNKNKLSNNPRTQAQELKNHYHYLFVQSSDKRPSNVFCNYCCKLGHISFECQLRKKNNNTNIV
jgi:superoxide dismutase